MAETDKEFLLRILGNSPQPLSLRTLWDQGITPGSLAVWFWDAIDKGEIELTDDWCLRAAPTEGETNG